MTSLKGLGDIDAEVGAIVAKVEEDRVARLPVGKNVVENDGKSCTHEVAWPPGQTGSLLPPPKRDGPPAREYPFKIDPFQQTAVNALEAGHSVLVAAHTSAGKTVVAEYAFAMALRYRELAQEFVDVGLMTGDVTINPNASCLVMTTEILRSMLYRGSEVVREVALIVYDEIHYLRDKERGVVWEESIIMAPKGARFAFLSATIPNALEFAEWVAKVHGSPCHVVYTDYRPTPLQHYVFPAGGDSLMMVVDERGVFRDDNFQKAVAALNDAAGDGGNKKGGKGGDKGAAGPQGVNAGEKSDIFKIVKMIMERNYDPVIVFSFSKKECETLALNMASLDLNNDEEKKMTHEIYEAALACLSAEDRRLPQIANLLPMLKRGVGVHHSGLLPICKEVTEVLFQEGLLKVLFATETFSTGLNMPAKTVVFTNVKKYDGGAFRWVTSGEYIQMSGRAGRRGLDDRGVVILMLDSKLEPAVAREMIKGAPDTMNSEFHLGYNMLLNLVRNSEGTDPEALMARSFRQFQVERSLPSLKAKVEALAAKRSAMIVEDEEEVAAYCTLLEQYALTRHALRAAINHPRVALPFLQPGRLVRVMPEAFEPSDPAGVLPQYGSTILAPADGAGPEDPESSGVVGPVVPYVWGAIVNFERVGKKGALGADGEGDSSDDASSSGSGSESDSGSDSGGSSGGGKGKRGKKGSKRKDSKKRSRKGKKDKGSKKKKRRRGGEHGGGKKQGAGGDGPLSHWVVDVLVQGEEGWNGSSPGIGAGGRPRIRAVPASKPGSPHVVTFPLAQIDRLSSVRIHLQRDLRPLEARTAGVRTVAEAVSRLVAGQGRVPLLDPEDDIKVPDKGVRKVVRKLEGLEDALRKHKLATTLPTEELARRLAALQAARALEEEIAAAKRAAREAAGLVMREELRARMRVLRRLTYVSSEGVLSMKGKCAAEIQSGDELVLCEMLFGGAFNTMNLEQLVATASCFVWREKSERPQPLSEQLVPCLAAVRDAARRVGKVASECGMPGAEDVEGFVDSFRPDLMEVVAAWVRGAKFAELAKMTDIFEGSVVRAVRRLEELLRQLKEALAAVGEIALSARFEEAGTRIRRDIVFAASLYL